MNLFSKWLMLKEAVDENVINNYAISLLRTALTDGVHFADYKTLVDLASKYISNLPENEKVNAFQKVQSKIKEVANSVAGSNEEEAIDYLHKAFNFPPIDRMLQTTEKVSINQLQFEDYMEEFINGELTFKQFKSIISANPDLFHLMNKQDRKRVLTAISKVAMAASSPLEKENILDFMDDMYKMG